MFTNKYSRHLMLGAAAMAVLALAACSQQAEERGEEGTPPVTAVHSPQDVPRHIDGATLRGPSHYNYDIVSSVTEVAAKAQVGAVGRIVGWSDGRTVHDGDEALRTAILEIKVDQELLPGKADSNLYIEVSRGGTLINPDGTDRELQAGEEYTQRSIDELSKAAPAGSRVLLLGVPAPRDDELEAGGGRVVRTWTSPHPEAKLLRGVPQGLFFEDADGSYVSGVVEQADVESGDWPAATGEKAGTFQQLIDQLSRR